MRTFTLEMFAFTRRILIQPDGFVSRIGEIPVFSSAALTIELQGSLQSGDDFVQLSLLHCLNLTFDFFLHL